MITLIDRIAEFPSRLIGFCGASPHAGLLRIAVQFRMRGYSHAGLFRIVVQFRLRGFRFQASLRGCYFAHAGLLLFPTRGSFFGSAVARRPSCRRRRPSLPSVVCGSWYVFQNGSAVVP